MPVEHKKYKKRRSSYGKNSLRPSKTVSKFHQDCYSPRGKKIQETKRKYVSQSSIKQRKKYEILDDDDNKFINEDTFDFSETFLDANKAHDVFFNSRFQQLFLNSNHCDKFDNASSVYGSTYRVDPEPSIVDKYYSSTRHDLNICIKQLEKEILHPVDFPKGNFYSTRNMADEPKDVVEVERKMDSTGLEENEEEIRAETTDVQEDTETEEEEQEDHDDDDEEEDEDENEDEEEEEDKIVKDDEDDQVDKNEKIEDNNKIQEYSAGNDNQGADNEYYEGEISDEEEEEDEDSEEDEKDYDDEEEDQDDRGEKDDYKKDLMEKNIKEDQDTYRDYEIEKQMSEADEKWAALQKEIEMIREEVQLLQSKEDLTDTDKMTLENKQADLMIKIEELDELTKKIQDRIGVEYPPLDKDTDKIVGSINDIELQEPETATDKVDRWKAWEAVSEEDMFDLPQESYPENKLPRLIVCGSTEDRIPRVVVADSYKKPSKIVKHLEEIAGKLSDALNIQEQLAKENAQLEGGKYTLQEALLEKDNTVETLQQKVCNLQTEMKMIVKENAALNQKLALLNERVTYQSYTASCSGNSPRYSPRLKDNTGYCNPICESIKNKKCPGNDTQRLTGGGSRENLFCLPQLTLTQNQVICGRGPASNPSESPILSGCPAEMEDKLMNYASNTKQLEQQLDTMETDVRKMKIELANTQRERQQLKQQSKLLRCTGPCAPCPCPNSGNVPGPMGIGHGMLPPYQVGDSPRYNKGINNCPLQQLRDLREQYSRLQEDHKNKMTEVSCLRTDAERMKQALREAKDANEKLGIQLIDLQERVKFFESDKERLNGSKEQIIEQEQSLIVTRKRYREAQDELEELRALMQDQANQIEDYRNKYLEAQERVEEQKRQLDLMEMDNAHMNENVTLEINRVKNQFQEKLAELAPLPEILTQTQSKLQECRQMRMLAERKCEELTRQLMSYEDKIGTITSQSQTLIDENHRLRGSNPEHLDDLDNKNRELRNENERLKNALARLEERDAESKKKLDEKMHEIVQLNSMLEQVREDSARQVARTKERCETIRRSMQGQINEMEKQLVQCRAAAKAAQRDRDEIRQKMQGQINHLTEEFASANGRIRTLQGHVNYLKSSYSNILNPDNEVQFNTISPVLDSNQQNSCDCNH